MSDKSTKRARIDAQNLKQSIGFAAKIIERRSTMPVLGMVKVKAKGGAVTISATDLDIYYTETIDADHVGEFEFLIRLGAIQQVLKYAEGVVEVEKTSDAVRVKNGGLELVISDMIDPCDFPLRKEYDHNLQPFEINQSDLLKVVKSTYGAISTEETRYYLNGVHIFNRDGFLTAEATDGHRLIRYSPKLPWGAGNVILPRKTCNLLAQRVRKGGNMPVKITGTGGGVNPKEICFEADGWSIHSKLIDGTFPDTDRVIPKLSDKIDVTLSHDQVRRLPMLKGIYSRSVAEICGKDGKISIKSNDGETVDLPISGRGPAVGFNLKYIKDLTRDFETIRIRSENVGAPAHVTVEDPDFTIILMPMRV